jgi:hypothetical protein
MIPFFGLPYHMHAYTYAQAQQLKHAEFKIDAICNIQYLIFNILRAMTKHHQQERKWSNLTFQANRKKNIGLERVQI